MQAGQAAIVACRWRQPCAPAYAAQYEGRSLFAPAFLLLF